MIDKSWFIEQFDQCVNTSGDGGSVVEKSRDAVAQAYVDGVESDPLMRWKDEVKDEARALFDRWVKPVREHRKSSLRKSAEYLIDILNDETILGSDDPVLDQAFPLGDGRDKTLRFWTGEDWRSAATERYRNAAASTEAARRFDETAELFARALTGRGVTITGALFTDGSAS